MGKDARRSRSLNWSREQTVVLAELKRDALLTKEDGRIVWERIAQTISSRFPDQIRSADQCRRRWDTVVKVYNHIEKYCVETGQDYWELDEDELASMRLEAAYRLDWYSIVKEVYSQRKRKERLDCDLVAGKMSKGSNTGSRSDVLPERTPVSHTLHMPPPVSTPSSTSECDTKSLDAHHEQSTTVHVLVSPRPSSEVKKLSLEEEILTLKRENYALMLELAQVRQHRQVTQQDQQVRQHAHVSQHSTRNLFCEDRQKCNTKECEPRLHEKSRCSNVCGWTETSDYLKLHNKVGCPQNVPLLVLETYPTFLKKLPGAHPKVS